MPPRDCQTRALVAKFKNSSMEPQTAWTVIAHRGARAFAPENTLAAFEKARQLDADMVEFDVQSSADGQPVVVHDDSLERCSNVEQFFPNRSDYRVGSFSFAQIQLLDAGSWFVHQLALPPAQRQAFLRTLMPQEIELYISESDRSLYTSGEVRHPTLGQALACCRDLGLSANIELKAPDSDRNDTSSNSARIPPSFIQSVVQEVHRHGLRRDVLVSSFDHESLRRVKEIDPGLRIGVLVAGAIGNPLEYCRALDAAAYHPGCLPGYDAVGFDSVEYQSTGRLPTALFRLLRDNGIAVNVWTVNDQDQMRALIAAGVTGLFTDYPNRVKSL